MNKQTANDSNGLVIAHYFLQSSSIAPEYGLRNLAKVDMTASCYGLEHYRSGFNLFPSDGI